MEWIFYSLLASMLWAIVNVTDKFTMSKLVTNPLVPLLVLGVMGLLVAGVIYFFYGFAPLTTLNLVWSFLAGLFYVFTMLFYYLALKYEEVSKVIPIYYLATLFIVLIAAEVLHEHLTHYQYWGIAFLLFGAILISLPSPVQLKISKGVGYMVLAAFFYALNQVVTKYLLIENEFWSVFAYIRIAIFLSLLPAFCWNLDNFVRECKKIRYHAYGIMTVNQFLNVMGVLAITLAMTSGYVSLVNALASVQPFFVLVLTILLGLYFPSLLQEMLRGWVLVRKLIAISLIFVGVLIVS